MSRSRQLSRNWIEADSSSGARRRRALPVVRLRDRPVGIHHDYTDQFPARPQAPAGATTCNTRIESSTGYRTYDNGKKMEYQAQRQWNALTSRFDW